MSSNELPVFSPAGFGFLRHGFLCHGVLRPGLSTCAADGAPTESAVQE
jgi:hypothetical protein